jgi:hypothetical protein
MSGFRAERIGLAAGMLAGWFAAIPPASLLTRHLSMRDDPAGLVGTWMFLLLVGSSLGGSLGRLLGQVIDRREASGGGSRPLDTTDPVGRADPIQGPPSGLRLPTLRRRMSLWLERLVYWMGFVATVSTWRNAIAHVTVRRPRTPEGEIGLLLSSGTGFLVAKDLVLTAWHVLDGLQKGDEIVLRFDFRDTMTRAPHVTYAILVKPTSGEDWALLRCADPPVDVKPLALVDQVEDGRDWKTFGYPDPDRTLNTDAIDLIGKITSGQAVLGGVNTIQLFSANARLLRLNGISGSPIMMSRKRMGAPDDVEWVAVGLTVEALTGNAQIAQENILYAYPMRRVLQQAGAILTDYDRPLLKSLRWLGRLPVRYAHTFSGGIPFWALIPIIAVVLSLAIRNWPDEWVIWMRADYPFQEVEEVNGPKRKGVVVKEVYAQDDPKFAEPDDPRLSAIQTGTDNGHYAQAAAGLKTRREWIRSLGSMMGANQKLLRVRLAFNTWYKTIDAEIQVEYDPLVNPPASPQCARVLGAVASLVRVRDLDVPGMTIGLPHLRDQLVFVDSARAKFHLSKSAPSSQRPPVLHLQPPNSGEALELLLHIEGVGTLPSSSASYRVKLIETRGPYR